MKIETDPRLEMLTGDIRKAVRAFLDYSAVATLITHVDSDCNSPYIVVGDDLALKRLCRVLGALDDCSDPGANVMH